MTDFTFCGDWDLSPRAPVHPLRVMILTSVRDTGTCDRNGIIVPTANGEKYMEGAVERLLKATLCHASLYGIVELVGVITDDIERDMRESDYPLTPQFGKPWIFPLDSILPSRTALMTQTHHFRSDFRELPLTAVEERVQRKFAFERKIASLMEFLHVDVLISDHYMAKLEHLIVPKEKGGFGLFGRVLNIHPAITVEGHPHCFRGKTPTADAIARAKTGVPTMTGATLHLIDAEIDHGPPIAYAAPTPVYAGDEPQWLRWRNYQTAKLPLIVAGLTHYATRIFPYLGTVDVNTLIARKAA